MRCWRALSRVWRWQAGRLDAPDQTFPKVDASWLRECALSSHWHPLQRRAFSFEMHGPKARARRCRGPCDTTVARQWCLQPGTVGGFAARRRGRRACGPLGPTEFAPGHPDGTGNALRLGAPRRSGASGSRDGSGRIMVCQGSYGLCRGAGPTYGIGRGRWRGVTIRRQPNVDCGGRLGATLRGPRARA